jgi:hypothetical protein
MLSARWIFVANLAATLAMVGAIWIVQVVHYPLFGGVGADGFPAYETEHSRRITYVVAPLMLVEAATSALLLWRRPEAVTAWAAWTGAALVLVIWASTFLLQVPMHEVLTRGFDRDAHARLVATNWIRTIAWTARGALVLWALGRA